jgi:hypothetical protein
MLRSRVTLFYYVSLFVLSMSFLTCHLCRRSSASQSCAELIAPSEVSRFEAVILRVITELWWLDIVARRVG